MNRGRSVTIRDDYRFARDPTSILLSILSPSAVELETDGMIVFHRRELPEGRLSGVGTLTCNPAVFAVSQELIAISDERLGQAWGDSLTRVLFSCAHPRPADRWEFTFRPGTPG